MIRVYSITHCPFCAQLKTLLTADGIEFVDVNVDLPENADEFQKLFEATKSDDVPMIKMGNRLLVPHQSFFSIPEAVELVKKFLS